MKNRLPNTARNATVATSSSSPTTPVAIPRRIPRLANQATAGSIAIESSQASSSRNRNEPSASYTYSAILSATSSSSTMIDGAPERLALELHVDRRALRASLALVPRVTHHDLLVHVDARPLVPPDGTRVARDPPASHVVRSRTGG